MKRGITLIAAVLLLAAMLLAAGGVKATGIQAYEPGEHIPTVEAETDVPDPYHTFVSTDFVESVVSEELLREDPRREVKLIDSRPKRSRYDRGHIPTAVSLPDREFEEMADEVLPQDTSTLLVFYCMNPG